MELAELAGNIREKISKRGYFILGIGFLLLLPFIMVATGFESIPILNIRGIPILSDVYAIGHNIGLFGSNTFVLRVFVLAIIFAIFAGSWDILSGYTGQFSFGHAVFWGFSAYIAFFFAAGFSIEVFEVKNFYGPSHHLQISFGFLNSVIGTEIRLDPLTALIAGALASTLLAIVIGIITLRLKGPYFALATLIIPLIAIEVIKVSLFNSITGGNFGIPNIPRIIESTGDPQADIANFYMLTLIVFFISIGILMLIAFSRVGLAFQAIREDVDAAESIGINSTFYKVLAFGISAFFAGIAGGLYAQLLNFVGPSFFDATFSFTVIILVVVGGIGSISGGIVAAFLLTILTELVLDDVFPVAANPGLDILAYGLILIVTLRYIPLGITRGTRDEKRAIVFGILLAISWTIIGTIIGDIFTWANNNILTFIFLAIMFIFSIPAIIPFFISEIIGLFLLDNFTAVDLVGDSLIKAKLLIYIIVGIPFAYYLPKGFKKVRLKYWGVWPSVGQFEAE